MKLNNKYIKWDKNMKLDNKNMKLENKNMKLDNKI